MIHSIIKTARITVIGIGIAMLAPIPAQAKNVLDPVQPILSGAVLGQHQSHFFEVLKAKGIDTDKVKCQTKDNGIQTCWLENKLLKTFMGQPVRFHNFNFTPSGLLYFVSVNFKPVEAKSEHDRIGMQMRRQLRTAMQPIRPESRPFGGQAWVDGPIEVVNTFRTDGDGIPPWTGNHLSVDARQMSLLYDELDAIAAQKKNDEKGWFRKFLGWIR